MTPKFSFFPVLHCWGQSFEPCHSNKPFKAQRKPAAIESMPPARQRGAAHTVTHCPCYNPVLSLHFTDEETETACSVFAVPQLERGEAGIQSSSLIPEPALPSSALQSKHIFLWSIWLHTHAHMCTYTPLVRFSMSQLRASQGSCLSFAIHLLCKVTPLSLGLSFLTCKIRGVA